MPHREGPSRAGNFGNGWKLHRTKENKDPKMRSLGVPQKRGTFPEEGPPSLRWDWGNFLPSTGQEPLPKKPSGKEALFGPWGERRKKDMEREEAGWGAAHW